MSEASRRSRVTITLGHSDQVVNRDGSELETRYELPRAGRKRSVKERLGNQLDSSFYVSESLSKRHRGEESFSNNDLQISQNDLRFKLMQKNAQRRIQSVEGSTMDLRAKLSRSEQHPCSLDSQPRMAEPEDVPLPPSRTTRGSSRMLSSSSSYSPWTLEDIRGRSPERFVSTSRGLSPLRNAGSIIGTSRALSSPPRSGERIIGTPKDLSPPRNAARIIGTQRGLSPPRNTRSFNSGSRAVSPTRNVGSYVGSSRGFSPARNPGSYICSSQHPCSLDTRPCMAEPRDAPLPPSRTTRGSSRMLSSSNSYSPWTLEDIRGRSPERFVSTSSRGLSPLRNAGSIIGTSRALSSPPRNAERIIRTPRDLSPPRNAARIIGSQRGLSPPRNTRSFNSGSRVVSPTRNVGSYVGSSRGFSPARNSGSYICSSRGSPPPTGIKDFHGRSRLLDDVRASPYTASASFPRPMLPPPVPNPHPLPPLSQLPPLGRIMQDSPFHVEEPPTVDSFLNSLGLGKYSLTFKREEVDMSTIKQMKESDLKDLIIPMGPRKKILEAIASLPKS